MTSSTSTDQTYLVDVRALGSGIKTYEVEAPNVAMAMHHARDLAAIDARVDFSRTHTLDVRLKPLPTLSRDVPYICGHVDPSGHDRACECTTCSLCDWPTEDFRLFVQPDGAVVCEDCIATKEV